METTIPAQPGGQRLLPVDSHALRRGAAAVPVEPVPLQKSLRAQRGDAVHHLGRPVPASHAGCGLPRPRKSNSEAETKTVFQALCRQAAAADGLTFDPETVR